VARLAPADRVSTAPVVEAGSFRDRHSRVFYRGAEVYRALSARALEAWDALSSTRFLPRLVAEGKVVRTERAEPLAPGAAPAGCWAGFLRHEPVPFVSYPYEWPFGMLKRAALLQLELMEAALAEDMILKDASPFNVQWRGTRPVFIDVASFERLAPGAPWAAFRQFCRMFLYPLLLQAHKGVPFQPWLRGRIEGIDAEDLSRLMSLRDLLRPGVLAYVFLPARLEAAGVRLRGIDGDLRRARFSKEMIQANLRRLRRLIGGLSSRRKRSLWSEYEAEHGYAAPDRARKEAFVERVARSRPWGLVWDLGCNTGAFSRIAAACARYVVAMDADVLSVDRLYSALEPRGETRVLCLVNDVADSSPDLGWGGRERRALPARGRPELTLCLALLHHLVIGANIPLDQIVGWLAGLGSDLVVEFATREDRMVRPLLDRKDDQYVDYGLEPFEARLGEAFEVVRREALGSGTRVLYHARPRARSGPR
jgi:SAM-dependent methyltransferase